MARPLFSVVLPVRDGALTIAETLASVRNQDCADWELIVVDDASIDRTIDVVHDRTRGMTQPVRIVDTGSHEAGGPGRARNLGMATANGSLVAFLDADDIWEPGYLSARAEAFRQHPDVAMVWGPSTLFHPGDPTRPDHVEGTELPEAVRRFEPGEVIRFWLHSLARCPASGAVVVRADVARSVAGFPESLRRGEDIAMWAQVATSSPVLWDDRPLLRFRRHRWSLTSRSARDGTQAGNDLEFVTWMAGFVHAHDLADCWAVAARDLHGAAQRAALDQPSPNAQWQTTRAMLAEPLGRRYGWWLLCDWLLPRDLAGHAATALYRRAGANDTDRDLVAGRHTRDLALPTPSRHARSIRLPVPHPSRVA